MHVFHNMFTIRNITKLSCVNFNNFQQKFSTSLVKFNVEKQIDENDKKTHFGFSSVKESEKAEKVHKVFKNVASSYDTMNDVMSLGIHRVWKDMFVEKLGSTANMNLLDVAGGTGDIAFRYIKYEVDGQRIPGRHVTVCDINDSMLEVGRSRAEQVGINDQQISWQQGDAEKLPFSDNSFAAYTIAFGIRNVTHVDRALAEAYRVLKPGGRFLCLEFSRVTNAPMQWIYDQYSFQMIPVMGQLVSGQWHAYQYLVESIRQFPDQDTFKNMIEMAGFRCVTYENLTMGVVAIHSGFKL